MKVNNEVVKEVGFRVNPMKDKIHVENKLISLPTAQTIHWIVLHKPKDFIVTKQDENQRQDILALIPQANDLRMTSVGRLSRNASGLILLTNDVGWIHPLTHPSFEHQHRYEVIVDGILTDRDLDPLAQGILMPQTNKYLPLFKSLQIKERNKPQRWTVIDVVIDNLSPVLLHKAMEK